MIHDSEMIVSSGVRSTLALLQSFLPLLLYDTEAPEDRSSSRRWFRGDRLRFGEECIRYLCRSLDDYLRQPLQGITFRRHMNMFSLSLRTSLVLLLQRWTVQLMVAA